MLATLILALLATASPPSAPGSSAEQLRSRMAHALTACGLKPDQFRIAFDDDVQDMAMTIVAPAAALSADQYACLAQMDKRERHFLFFDDDQAAIRFTEAHDDD